MISINADAILWKGWDDANKEIGTVVDKTAVIELRLSRLVNNFSLLEVQSYALDLPKIRGALLDLGYTVADNSGEEQAVDQLPDVSLAYAEAFAPPKEQEVE